MMWEYMPLETFNRRQMSVNDEFGPKRVYALKVRKSFGLLALRCN